MEVEENNNLKYSRCDARGFIQGKNPHIIKIEELSSQGDKVNIEVILSEGITNEEENLVIKSDMNIMIRRNQSRDELSMDVRVHESVEDSQKMMKDFEEHYENNKMNQVGIILNEEMKKILGEGKGQNDEFQKEGTVKGECMDREKEQKEEVKRMEVEANPKESSTRNQSNQGADNNLNSVRDLKKINSEGKYVISNKSLSKKEIEERYKPIIFFTSDDNEAYCTICMEEESFEDDNIVFCDLCNSAFHQLCYGSELINLTKDDDSEWFCQRCKHLLENNLPYERIQCEFCPEMKGVMKKIKEDSTQKWGHMLCVNWIPEMYYFEEKKKENVKIDEYWAKNSCGRKSLVCKICKIKYGDCIQCDDKKCIKSFHVTCAQRHGLICNWRQMADLKRKTDEEYYYPLYCKKHMKPLSQKMFEHSNMVEKTLEQKGEKYSYLMGPGVVKPEKKQILKKVAKRVKEPKEKGKKKGVIEQEMNELVMADKENNMPEANKSNVQNKDKSKLIRANPIKKEKTEEKFKSQEMKKQKDNIEKANPEPRQFKQIILGVKAKKSATNFENPVIKENIVKLNGETKNKDGDDMKVLYKFRADVGELMNLNSWADEKEIKKVIQDFIRRKKLYNRETENLIVSRDPKLEEIFGVSEIPHTQIFARFKHYMIKKSPEKETKKRKVSPEKNKLEESIGIVKKKVKVTTSSPSESVEIMGKTLKEHKKEVAKKLTPTEKNEVTPVNLTNESKETGLDLSRKKSEMKTTENEALKLEKRKSEQLAGEKKVNEELKLKRSGSSLNEKKKETTKPFDTSDFMSGFSNFKLRKVSESGAMNLNATSFMASFLGGDKPAQNQRSNKFNREEKLGSLASLVSGSDEIPFRRNMNWLIINESIPDIDSIFAAEVKTRLWPKGAEMLF